MKKRNLTQDYITPEGGLQWAKVMKHEPEVSEDGKKSYKTDIVISKEEGKKLEALCLKLWEKFLQEEPETIEKMKKSGKTPKFPVKFTEDGLAKVRASRSYSYKDSKTGDIKEMEPPKLWKHTMEVYDGQWIPNGTKGMIAGFLQAYSYLGNYGVSFKMNEIQLCQVVEVGKRAVSAFAPIEPSEPDTNEDDDFYKGVN